MFEKDPFCHGIFVSHRSQFFLSVIVMFVAVGKIINNLLGNLNFRF